MISALVSAGLQAGYLANPRLAKVHWQADVEDWLATGPGAGHVREFLAWAAGHGHCQAFDVPQPPRHAGTAISASQRWDLAARLLHDGTIETTDRVAGCLVLLFGQTMTRIAALTTSQVTRHHDGVTIQLGQHDVPVPAPLGDLLLTLIADGKPYTGIGSPAGSKWLFPGLLPGRPITPARLADRLRALGVPVQAGRRAALTDLAAQLPPLSSPTSSACTPPPPSDGCTRPGATGTATPPSWPAPAITNPGEQVPSHPAPAEVSDRVGTLLSTSSDSGAAIDEIAELIGHSSVSSTQIYVHPDPRRLRAAVERVGSPRDLAGRGR